jgi:hypothetical protein
MGMSLDRRGLTSIVFEAGEQIAEGLTISLTQPGKSTSRWVFRVRVRTDEGEFLLGQFSTNPPTTGIPSRVVAQASCPGAREWVVDVTPAPPVEGLVAVPDDSSVDLAIGHSTVSPAGVQRVNERPKYYSGVSGTVQLLPGEVMTGWTAWDAGAGATVTLPDEDAGTAIPLPPSGAADGSMSGLLQGPSRVVFAGTGGYLVEVAESA